MKLTLREQIDAFGYQENAQWYHNQYMRLLEGGTHLIEPDRSLAMHAYFTGSLKYYRKAMWAMGLLHEVTDPAECGQ